MKWSWQRWQVLAAGAALVGLGFVLGGRCDSRSSTAGDAGPSLEAPAPAPDDLIADVVVWSPNPSWGKLQRGIGGAIGILPSTLPAAIVAVSDLDAALGDELDGTAPMFGVVAGSPSDPGVALAIKLVDPRHARNALTDQARLDASAAGFTTRDVAGMTLLVPNRARSEQPLTLAITPSGYLLVLRRAADLERLGPYVSRTLPARHAGAVATGAAAVVEIPRSALARVLVPRLESMWKEAKAFLVAQDEKMRAERGRAPDFGDPAAIVAVLDGLVGRRLAVASDLEKVRLVLDVTDGAASISATLTPHAPPGPAQAWIDGMKVGDPSPVLALPATSALAIAMRDAEGDRAEQGKELEKAITSSLGARLKDGAKLHELVEATTKARDEALAIAYSADEPTGLFVQAPVRDAASAERAIRGAFDLTKVDPFKELLRTKDVTASSEELAGLGKASLLTLTREPSAAKRGKAAPTGVAWRTENGVLALGAGAEPRVTLGLGARPSRKLAEEPSLAHFVTSVANDASTVLVAQPLRFDAKRASLPAAPLGIALGRRGGDGFVQIEIADGLLREAARRQMGF